MDSPHDQTPASSLGSRRKDRIETQIHRRRKAKAHSPLVPEWDISQSSPPTQLRLSPSPKQSPDSIKQTSGALGLSAIEETVTHPEK